MTATRHAMKAQKDKVAAAKQAREENETSAAALKAREINKAAAMNGTRARCWLGLYQFAIAGPPVRYSNPHILERRRNPPIPVAAAQQQVAPANAPVPARRQFIGGQKPSPKLIRPSTAI